MSKTTYDRFWDKVVERSPEECWEWLGSHNKSGYGLFWPQWRTTWPAHRYMFWLENDIVDGNDIHHTCNNPGCVNPYHLEQVTRLYNIRQQAKVTSTTCKRGHLRTAEFVYIRPDGYRDCKPCMKIRRNK